MQLQAENEKKVEKMWDILGSSPTKDLSTGISTEKTGLSAGLSIENTRPSLINDELTRTSSMREESSLGLGAMPDATKAKTPKKPKMSDRDRRAIAKMNKMREEAEKREKSVESLKEKEDSGASLSKGNEITKEATLSKIKEEGGDNVVAAEEPSKKSKDAKKQAATSVDKNAKKISG